MSLKQEVYIHTPYGALKHYFIQLAAGVSCLYPSYSGGRSGGSQFKAQPQQTVHETLSQKYPTR
jgi:hypothetical protein